MRDPRKGPEEENPTCSRGKVEPGPPKEGDRPLRGWEERYRVEDRPFAEGGMGRIWKARDLLLERWVAVKSLKPRFVQAPLVRERFVRETRIMALLSHPGVCPIYDKYLSLDPPCYTMKLVQGETLQSRIDRIHAGGKAGLQEALPSLVQVMISLCNTLSFAHHMGVIHRDLKPENVLLGPFGEVYVMDWGLAKVRSLPSLPQMEEGPAGTSGPEKLSISGSLLGTPGYLSPEQARGNPEEIDEKTDVYGLAALFHHCLTGSPPHRGKSREALLAQARRNWSPPLKEAGRWIPRDLEAIRRKALAPDKADRYESVEALGRDFQRFLEGRTVSAYSYRWWEKAAKWAARNRRPLTAAGGATLAALLMITLLLFFHSRDMGRAAREARRLRAHALARLAESQELLGRPLLARKSLAEAERVVPAGDPLGRRIPFLKDETYRRARPPFEVLPGDGRAVTGIAFLRGGRWLLEGLEGGAYRVLDASTGRVIAEEQLGLVPGSEVLAGGVGDLAVLVLVEGWEEKRLPTSRLFLARPGRGVARFLLGTDWWIRGVRLFPGKKGPILVCDGERGPGLVLDLSADPPIPLVRPKRGEAASWARGLGPILLFSWPGETGDRMARFQDAGTGREVYAVKRPYSFQHFALDRRARRLLLAHHRNWSFVDLGGRPRAEPPRTTDTRIQAALLTPSGERAVLVERSGLARVWDLEGRRLLGVFGLEGGECSAAALDPSGRVFVTGGRKGRLNFFSLPAEGEMEGLRHKGYVRSLAFSRDGRFLLSGGQEGSLILWDLQAGRALARRKLPWKEGLFSAALSPRGDRILCGGDKGGLLLMETGTGRILARPAGHRERVWTVGFGPKGRLAASGSRDRTARVWDLERGVCLSVLRGHGSSIRGVRFSPDGKRLATTGVDGILRLWSVPEGRLLGAFPLPTQSTLYQVFFAGPGRLLSSDHDGRLLLLDSRAGKVEEIGRSAEAALGLDPAPGKGLALLAAMDGKVRLFDLPRRLLLWESLEVEANYYSAAFSPGEERFAAGRDDGRIFLSRLGWARREVRLRAEAERLRALLRERPEDKEAALKLALLYAGRGGFLPAARTALDLERRGALPARVEFALAFREAGFPGKAREILRRIGRARPLSVYERLLEAALERDLRGRAVSKSPGGR